MTAAFSVCRHAARATGEPEAHIAARGKALPSVDATDGGTMLFALDDPPAPTAGATARLANRKAIARARSQR